MKIQKMVNATKTGDVSVKGSVLKLDDVSVENVAESYITKDFLFYK